MIFIRIGQFFRPGPDRLRENRSASSDALADASFPPVSAPAVPVPEIRFPCHPPLPDSRPNAGPPREEFFSPPASVHRRTSMRRLLHAVCTHLYLRTGTGASRLIFPVPPVFAIEHNRGPPCRKFRPHRLGAPVFARISTSRTKTDRPAAGLSLPQQAVTRLQRKFFYPSSSQNVPQTGTHFLRPNTGTQDGRGTAAIIHRQLPCSIRTRCRPPPAHRGNVPATLGVLL